MNVKNIYQNIALRDGYETRYTCLEICRLLKRDFNSNIYVYVVSEDGKKAYMPAFESGLVQEIVVENVLADYSLLPVNQDHEALILAEGVAYEKMTNATYGKMRMTSRIYGNGFCLGGINHHASQLMEKPNHLQLVNAYNHLFAWWLNEFKTKKITLLMNGLPPEACLAKMLGIAYRMLFAARIENYFYWCYNTLMEFPQVEEEFYKIKSTDEKSKILDKQYHHDRIFRDRYHKTTKLKRLWRSFCKMTYKHLYYSYYKNRGSAKGYYYLSKLSYIWRWYRLSKEVECPIAVSFESIKDKSYFYFPLSSEPETAIQWTSQEYYCQLTAIVSVCRDLPANTILVVKEHIYSIGSRPDNFFKQIKKLKNALVVDCRADPIEMIKHSRCVITIAGTAGLEAAVLGKPVILFGRHNYYGFLSHVFLVDKEEKLSHFIKKITDGHVDLVAAKDDGIQLHEAIAKAGFDMGNFMGKQHDQFEPFAIQNAYQGLLALGEFLESKRDVGQQAITADYEYS